MASKSIGFSSLLAGLSVYRMVGAKRGGGGGGSIFSCGARDLLGSSCKFVKLWESQFFSRVLDTT